MKCGDLAKIARFAVTKALRAVNFNILTERAGLDYFLRQGGVARDTTAIFRGPVYTLCTPAALLTPLLGLGPTSLPPPPSPLTPRLQRVRNQLQIIPSPA